MHTKELSIIMPCYNEEECIIGCIEQAKKFLEQGHIDGEIIVVDDGSTDASLIRAFTTGARIMTSAHNHGYGTAVRKGISVACGKYVIIGDCDGSYDFSSLKPFTDKFKDGYDLVIGNRYGSQSDKKAFKPIRKLGACTLSYFAKVVSGVNITDYHCGLRGGNTEKLRALGLKTTGFEFATEMIMKSGSLRVCEVPIKYSPDTREQNKSKLKPVRDGLRHLLYIVSYRIGHRGVSDSKGEF